jgi:uncharacterized membrane protein (DUF4010 family)
MPFGFEPGTAWSLLAALLIGVLVGVEREKSKSVSGNVGIGGLRTFTLFALAGAFGGLLAQTLGAPLLLAVVVLSVAALAAAGYLVQSRSKPEAIGLTTETAAVAVCLLGAACTTGHAGTALAGGIAVSALLAYKEPLHGLTAKLGPDDVAAGIKLLAASFIVLPLLPDRAVDPWGALVPRSLWLLVILIAGLSLVGYVATRALGTERGTAITGLTGGLVSSTAVTLSFARRSRDEGGASDDALAAGTFLAWSVMFVRVVVLAAIVHAPLVRPLVLPFGAMLAVTVVFALLLLRRARAGAPHDGTRVPLRNPFSLLQAAKFGLMFAAVLLVMALAEQYFPQGGPYAVAAIAGATDVDAVTLGATTRARDGASELGASANAILIAVLSNTIVKCGVSAVLGQSRLRRLALLLGALLLAVGAVALALA